MSLHIASAKLPQHITAKSAMTGRISPNKIFSPNIKLRKASIICVNGLSITAIANPPDKFSVGKSAELKKKMGSTIAVIMVS